jgi:hypothetical protein
MASQVSRSSSGTIHYISSFLSYQCFTNKHLAFLSALSHHLDPTFYSEITRHPHWRDVMAAEIQALKANHTWTLQPLPSSKTLIGCKLEFKTKFRVDGSIERHKARLVAKGYTQVEGLDYHDTFAPVAKLVTVRCVVATAAARHWHLFQLDVHNAFLHGDLDEDVYMTPSPGYYKQIDIRVCHLQKSLYGLKQASRNWFSKLSSVLLVAGFTQSQVDHSLITRHRGQSFTLIVIYVDDILLAGNDLTDINNFKAMLVQRFKLKDLGQLKYFLGLEIARSPTGIFLSQRKYALDILADSDHLGACPSSFLIEQHLKLNITDSDLLPNPSSFC